MSPSTLTFSQFCSYLKNEKIFDQFGLKKIGVFGSFARDEKYNDIDLLIEEELDYKKLISLKNKLESDLQITVDIMIRKFAEPIILHRALKDVRYATAA
jgi:hypothetical protein